MAFHVLIVEDEPDISEVLSRLVRSRGDHAEVVACGADVLPAIQRRLPDLILLDLMLPDMDGYALCEQLKRDRETNLIPILMVTALGDLANQVQGVRVGANGYITKPFDPNALFQAMDEAIAWRQEHLEHGTEGEIHFQCRGEVGFLHDINDLLTDLYSHTPLDERQVKDLRQALVEMGTNAIEWGHCKNAELLLHITYRIEPSQITLVIRDQGPGFNPHCLPHAASDENPIGHLDVRNEMGLREGGFGIMLARGLVDEFRYNEQGNEVTLVKRFNATAATLHSASGLRKGVSTKS
jgi:two-component system OmpR family response regulator